MRKAFYLQLLLVGIGFVILFILAYKVLPLGEDWNDAFRPAAQELIRGRNPYAVSKFFMPPWILILLLPFALLPAKAGYVLLVFSSVTCFLYIAKRSKAPLWLMVLFIFTPPVIFDLWAGNINAFAMLGFLLPPQLGLFLVTLKPQIGIGICIYWLFEAWRKGRFREVFRVFFPVSISILLSVLIYGPWIFNSLGLLDSDINWNTSLWPMSIPFGLILMAAALRKKNPRYAYAASPFLSPYLAGYSWVVVIYAVLPLPLESVAAIVGFWLAIIIGSL